MGPQKRDGSTVSVARCETYDLDVVRQAVDAVLAPLGGIDRFVRPGMRVLLKPNLLAPADLDRAVTTHPAVVQAVTELVQGVGGTVLIGDSPGGPGGDGSRVWRPAGMGEAAGRTGASLVPFDGVAWKRVNGFDYFLARPVLEADLVINLPKLKTHMLTLYTGGVKNLFGAIPGSRKREVHCRAPGVQDFSRALVDVLALTRPGLTLIDGVLGQEGNGPGVGGTPRRYGCLAASTDPVALDAVVAGALGYQPGEVLHLAQAQDRGLGVADLAGVQIEGDRRALDFGPVSLPRARWYLRVPAWVSAPVHRAIRLRPRLNADACVGCGRCAEACPRHAIAPGQPPCFDLDRCVADLAGVHVVGDRRALDFDPVSLPRARWYFRVPAWVSARVHRAIRLRPRLDADACVGCGRCAEACPRDAIAPGQPPCFDLDRCVGCLCCAEVCPQGAVTPHRNLIARLVGVSG